jgi:hypothetical protein
VNRRANNAGGRTSVGTARVEGRVQRCHGPDTALPIFVACLAATAISVFGVGCADSQSPVPNDHRPPTTDALESVEIDGMPISLPQTRLVTCIPQRQAEYFFSWTGANQLVPRRPLEEEQHSSRVSIRFGTDPPTVESIELQLDYPDNEIRVSESTENTTDRITIARSGTNQFVLWGPVHNQRSEQQVPQQLRIRLACTTRQ